ncbi:MAG TPA: hypothetical protein VF695_04800, partial [Sphingomonas sp.]
SDLEGLAAFDTNGDGLFSALDDEWASFRVWRDRNEDGTVDGNELMSMDKADVASITLTGTATEQSWGWGENVIINNGYFTRTDQSTAALGDVALTYSKEEELGSVTAPDRYPLEAFESSHSSMRQHIFLLSVAPLERFTSWSPEIDVWI